jgi:uncharacterized protein YegP (UPF0339 family)
MNPEENPMPDESAHREAALRESFARVRPTSGVSAGCQSEIPLVFTHLVRGMLNPTVEGTMTIELYKGKGRHPWRWRLVSKNGKTIADSAEGYHNSSNLRRAARRLPIKAIIRWA